MLTYYLHLQIEAPPRLYMVEAESSDEQALLTLAGQWNREYAGSFYKLEDIYRVEGMAGRLALPPELYPARNPHRERYPASMLGR